MVLDYPFCIELMGGRLRAHASSHQPLAGKVIEKRGSERRLLSRHTQSRKCCHKYDEALHGSILHSDASIVLATFMTPNIIS